ncbi:MAG: tRNA (guanosine(37)-N1)-methyltransferase TrmD [Candidatus Doudnabacteria bacterium]|nr:tRNA (guanosine(37)-N1)-methyltransferase TrmD [Candidatus Doudnabacteria bacterium]
MQINILTLFPGLFDSFLNESLIGKAREAGLLDVRLYDFREQTTDAHNTVDDKPYGGGAGMVLQIDPIYQALKQLKPAGPAGQNYFRADPSVSGLTLLMTPEGEQLSHTKAEELSQLDQLTLICGRYEGFDERITTFVDGKLSIGSYVLSGGELAAQVTIEALSRFVPGVIGKEESVLNDTFAQGPDHVEAPVYTRPEVYTLDDGTELKVPDILLSGNHGEIEKWRQQNPKSR